MIYVLLANLKVQIWLLPCCKFKNPDMVDVPDMVIVLLTKKPKYGCCPAGIFNSQDMIDVLLVPKESRHGY